MSNEQTNSNSAVSVSGPYMQHGMEVTGPHFFSSCTTPIHARDLCNGMNTAYAAGLAAAPAVGKVPSSAFGKVRCFRRSDGQTIEGCDRIRFRSHGTCELVYKDDTFECLPMHLSEAERAVSRGIWVEVNDTAQQAFPAPPVDARAEAVEKLVKAAQSLLDIIHDDLTHARQAELETVLSAARNAIRNAGVHP